MHGSLPAWRTFESGMDNGEDVRQLETLLRDMGYFDYEPDNHFSWATTSAIMKWQKAVGLPRPGPSRWGAWSSPRGPARGDGHRPGGGPHRR